MNSQRRIRRLMCAGTVALLLAAPVSVRAFVLSGTRLVDLMREYEKSQAGKADVLWGNMGRFEGYVIGVCDSLESTLVLPDSTSYDQVVAAVAKYVKGHPEQWKLPGYDLVKRGLLDSFPRR